MSQGKNCLGKNYIGKTMPREKTFRKKIGSEDKNRTQQEYWIWKFFELHMGIILDHIGIVLEWN